MPRLYSRPQGRWKAAFAALCIVLLASTGVRAHDIPNEIILRGFVKPEGHRLHVLLRVPLVLFIGVNLPKRGPGYLDLEHVQSAMSRAIAAVTHDIGFYENGRRLSSVPGRTRISLPSESAFGSYEEALAHIQGPALPTNTLVFWNQGYLDLALQYPINSDRSAFTMDFGVGAGLPGRLKMAVRFMPPGGQTLAYVVHGGHGPLQLNPRWYRAAVTFVRAGFAHILDGTDHLLFLLCLVLPFRLREFWRLTGVVTAFTGAHSVTLIASALGVVPSGNWFPPLIEDLIALSIVYMAVENVVLTLGPMREFDPLRWRWLITTGFGLVHGFGFSFALRQDLQFAGTHLLVSLLSFNVGVELGQMFVLLLILPLAALLMRQVSVRRLGIAISSVLVAHTAWHWLVDRTEALSKADWPMIDGQQWFAVTALTALVVLVGGMYLLMVRASARRRVQSQQGHT